MNWKLIVFVETIIVVGLIVAWFLYPTPAAEAPRLDEAVDSASDQVSQGELDSGAVDAAKLAKVLRSTMWYWEKTTTGQDVVAPQKANMFTIQFAPDGRVNGTTDCNSFSGTYTLTENVLTVGPLGMTKMFCPDAQESQFVGFLSPNPLTVSFTPEGELQMTANNGAAEMRLTPR